MPGQWPRAGDSGGFWKLGVVCFFCIIRYVVGLSRDVAGAQPCTRVFRFHTVSNWEPWKDLEAEALLDLRVRKIT